MNEANNPPQTAKADEPEQKRGLFGRLLQKLDKAMQQKAKARSQQGCCCGDAKSKGDKCC